MTDSRGQLYSQSRPVDPPYHLGDDPRPLQRLFSTLFDEAAQAVFLAGLDLDDVLVERFFCCRTGHGLDWDVPADFLADAEDLSRSVRLFLCGLNRADDSEASIVALKVEVRMDSTGLRDKQS